MDIYSSQCLALSRAETRALALCTQRHGKNGEGGWVERERDRAGGERERGGREGRRQREKEIGLGVREREGGGREEGRERKR